MFAIWISVAQLVGYLVLFWCEYVPTFGYKDYQGNFFIAVQYVL